MAGMYAVYHGPIGLREISNSIHLKAVYLYQKISKLGIEIKYSKFFDTITIICDSKKLNKIALSRNVNFCNLITNQISISVNEKTDRNDLDQIISILEEYSGQKSPNIKFPETQMLDNVRESEILSHPVFNSYHSETSLMRYIKSLENKDLSLTQSMISLGSCTMKLNAASEMIPLSWTEWNSIHPFVPVDQARGYHEVISKLETFLSEITGFSATSLQPNSGAQGEYSGLMVIKSYLNKIGQSHRDICLIPSSAHGTNPASAIMSGLKVVVIGTDDKGNIDIENLKIKVEEHKDSLAALMITYPSTHGVFESEIQYINDLIHKNGGQVYMDGANMNAQVGLTSPKIIGADVCHLNLHKTFSIPHGGGGPGVGPICVAEHLKDFLPSNPVITTGGKHHIEAISSAPWGSSLVCLISYGYIRMLGKSGIKESTEIAIINANYMKTKLEKNFTILYSGENGRSAHEFIIDCREFKKYKIEVIDIAKRLIDYGFHAPTVSFPVPGTMMIEPTESENLSQLDRFCDALNSIYLEITSKNESDREMLRNSPHTLKMLTASNWEYNYSRENASFPKSYLINNKHNVSFHISTINSTISSETPNNLIKDYKSNFKKIKYNYREVNLNNKLIPIKLLTSLEFLSGERKDNFGTNNQNIYQARAFNNFNITKKSIIYINVESFLLNSNNYYLNEMLLFGGINSIRGFEENSIPTNKMFLINSEFRFKLNNDIYINSIIDSAYYENIIENNSINIYGVGFGLNINTNSGVFRINYANGIRKGQDINLTLSKIHLIFSNIF